MSKPTSFYGSINFTDLKEALKNNKVSAKRVSTQKGEKIFVDVNFWVKEEANQFGQNASLQVQFKKEFINDEEKKPYIGDFRFMASKESPLTAEDIAKETSDEDDLPF